MILLVFFWLVFSLIIGFIARAYNRSGLIWFVLALVLSPLVAGILLLLLPRSRAGQRQCPSCHEYVAIGAKKCHHCGHEFATDLRGVWNETTISDKLGFAGYLANVPVMFIAIGIHQGAFDWSPNPAHVSVSYDSLPVRKPPPSMIEEAQSCAARRDTSDSCAYAQAVVHKWEQRDR